MPDRTSLLPGPHDSLQSEYQAFKGLEQNDETTLLSLYIYRVVAIDFIIAIVVFIVVIIVLILLILAFIVVLMIPYT